MAKLISQITPLLITFNEEPNIGRVLSKLSWASQILVIDSGSTDATLEIFAASPRIRVIHRKFDSFAQQCNFGLQQIETPWVLSMDADYELSDPLVSELKALEEEPSVSGYRARFVYRIHGRRVRGSLYPPRTILYRTTAGRYVDEGHGHRLRIEGEVKPFNAPVYHDDRKPLSRWIASQRRYAEMEADMLMSAGPASLSAVDRIRKMAWPAPLIMLFYVLIVKGSLLSGWAGWYYALQRSFAEVMIALELIDRRFSGRQLTLGNKNTVYRQAQKTDESVNGASN